MCGTQFVGAISYQNIYLLSTVLFTYYIEQSVTNVYIPTTVLVVYRFYVKRIILWDKTCNFAMVNVVQRDSATKMMYQYRSYVVYAENVIVAIFRWPDEERQCDTVWT